VSKDDHRRNWFTQRGAKNRKKKNRKLGGDCVGRDRTPQIKKPDSKGGITPKKDQTQGLSQKTTRKRSGRDAVILNAQ